MTPTAAWPPPRPPDCNAALVLADGTVFWGRGVGAAGQAVGEVCFNTSMTGYQEILTDPSYAGQIITFTFPHIGNVGTNHEDIEAINAGGARPACSAAPITEPANWRAEQSLDAWLKSHGIVGLSRRRHAAAHAAHPRRRRAERRHRLPARRAVRSRRDARGAQAWPGLDGMDLAIEVTCRQSYSWDETAWRRGAGYGKPGRAAVPRRRRRLRRQAQHPAHARRARLPGHGGAGDRHAPRRSCATSPTASSCRTARATRPRPANTPCR